MLLFKAHPGLSVFPAALPTTWQLQLMQSALVEWPDPPARTNHTTAYGEQLHGLFRAAQEDLSLQHQQQKDPPSACQQQQQPETHCGMLSGGAALATMQQAPAAHQQLGAASVQQEHLHRQADDLDQEQAAAELISKLSHCCCCCCCCCCQQQAVAASTTTKGQLGTSWSSSSSSHGRDSICRCGEQQPPGIKQALGHLSSSASCPPAASSATPTDRWSVRGAGPSAALLLRKLRWVCLGPPYNWTDRVYEPHLIHRPLPDSLVRLARQFAAWAANWCNTPVGAAAAASVPPAADHQAAGVSPTAAGNVMLAAMAAAEQPASGTYMPDAALVNYYHAGDTLNGHADDVEPDLSQPIVTISLGCPAVFLMGGLSKDVAPTAMLLRSGDVVVLSGEARRCYHGLPRVLDDQDLPDDVVAAGQQQQETFGAILEHMRHCRINISVRAVH
jgi:alkylated DNA repair protein alkB family protein 1